MAQKRMFSKDITESDSFADMPLSTQALYFHLGMNADDDGFVNNAKKIQRSIGASQDDLGILIAKRFIIPFESGVVVIKHWRINNKVQSDRYHETKYQEEMALLTVKENKAYSLKNVQSDLGVSILDTKTSRMDTQDRLDIGIEEKRNTLSGKPDHASEVSEIVDYLNAVAGTRYKPTTRNTIAHIKARLKEGYTVDDFKAVIDCKCREWANGEMAKYLRPDTLFSPKFEGYLNQASSESTRRSKYAKYA